MQKFDLYNPQQFKEHQILLKKYEKPQSGYDEYFVKDGDFIILYGEKLHVYPATSPRYGEQKLIADQLEMPLAAVRWYVNVIEQKFFRSPEEGGLPANKISYREEVAGENLHIMRSMSAGCVHPGYALTNSSRNSHILASSRQTFSASDPWLFQGGLLDFLKDIAARYEQSKL
jgi:hypothetical protein